MKTFKVEHITNQGGKTNEDSFYTGEKTFGVFDGATPFDDYVDEHGVNGAKLASLFLAQSFSNESEDLVFQIEDANKNLQEKMILADRDTTDKALRWSTTAAVVRCRDTEWEWIQIGDSVIVVEYTDGRVLCLNKDYDHDQENLQLAKSLIDKGEKEFKTTPEYREQVFKVRRNTNITYGCINGEVEAMNFLQKGTFSLADVRSIYLLTDGIFLPKEDYRDADDFVEWVRLYKEKGLDGLVSYIRKLENEDPTFAKYTRFKPHDDATAVVITFN